MALLACSRVEDRDATSWIAHTERLLQQRIIWCKMSIVLRLGNCSRLLLSICIHITISLMLVKYLPWSVFICHHSGWKVKNSDSQVSNESLKETNQLNKKLQRQCLQISSMLLERWCKTLGNAIRKLKNDVTWRFTSLFYHPSRLFYPSFIFSYYFSLFLA